MPAAFVQQLQQTLHGLGTPFFRRQVKSQSQNVRGLGLRCQRTFCVKEAFDEGIFINPVIPPACAPQDTLVRVALMATHTKEQVDYAVEKLTKCFRELGIIK